jgi:hypothetical protein
MKKALIALVFPLVAHAQAPTKEQACRTQGLAYTVAIQGRDFGLSPEQSLARMRGMESQGVNERFLKAVINSVYFDPQYSDVHGDSLQYEATSICMHPDAAWKPLK